MSSEHSLLSSALSELLQSGRQSRFDPDKVRYVCHTSTIPLPTTVDEQSLLINDENTVEVTHSIKYQPGYDPAVDYRCCLKHCMYARRNGTSEHEILRSNCPCGKISFPVAMAGEDEPVETFLQPLCFIQVMKEMRYKFGYTDASACETDGECCHKDASGRPCSNRPKVEYDEIMFCQNSQSITDSSYSRPLRMAVGASGWEHLSTHEQIGLALDQLYWYRKFVGPSTRKFLGYMAEKHKVFAFRQRITHVLHTMTGQVTQKILLFPCEMESYRALARLSASLFEELVRDYFHEVGDEPTDESSIYKRMKSSRKLVKQSFCSTNLEVRVSVFDIILEGQKNCAFTRFWAGCFRKLKSRVLGLEKDYTLSPVWIYTMGGFSQTRNLGWLPEWVAEPLRKQFRDNLGRPKVIIPKQELRLVYQLVMKRLYDEGLELKFLEVTGRHNDPDFREVIHGLRIPLKPSASNNSTVSSGGKVEDARQLFGDAIRNGWRVPVRSLETGAIKSWLEFSQDLREEKPGYEGHLFWLALQIIVNWFAHNGFADKLNLEPVDLPNSKYWENALWQMQIVHISEPGKERNLTKTSALVSWVLTVASKVCQSALAFCQDHRAGLVLSAQDWMHQRRISAESYESYWMYDRKTRLRMDDVVNGFQDWTESTDFICRLVGGTALQALLVYIGFPRWFSDIVLKTALQDYAVTEILKTTYDSDSNQRDVYSGFVREGFMMSMPLTKTILHLMHDVNIGLVHEILKGRGIEISPRPQEVHPDLDRDRPGAISMLQGE